MFTGIVETLGTLLSIEKKSENVYLKFSCDFLSELKIDQSVAHNGICMTVTNLDESGYTVCAVPETISKTTIGEWKPYDKINLERCMLLHARLDGHLVQGHIDCTSVCLQRINHENYWNYIFTLPKEMAHLVVEKGSVTVNGTSLTCFNVNSYSFEVAIIPYTFEYTNFHSIEINSLVNIEFDIIGKYVARKIELGK